MNPRFLKKSDLITRPDRPGRYPWSATTHWRKVKEGKFPPPVTVAGILCWQVDVLDKYDAEQIAGSAK